MSFGLPPTSILPPSPSQSSLGVSRRPNAISLPKPPHLQEGSGSSWVCGLQTPPIEDMSTTYQPSLAAYENHAMHGYPSSLAHVQRARMGMSASTNGQVYQQPPLQQPQPSQQPQYPNWPTKDITFTAANQLPSNGQPQQLSQQLPQQIPQQAVRPPSPASGGNLSVPRSGQISRRNSETLVYHSLEIPRCISPNGGNLAEFAAQVGATYPYLPLFTNDSQDDMPFLVRIQRRTQASRDDSIKTSQLPDSTIAKISEARRAVSKMDAGCVVNDAGHAKRHFAGAAVYLPPQNVLTNGQGTWRERVSSLGDCAHAGQQM